MTLLWFRFFKWLGMALFFGGTLSACLASKPRNRAFSALWITSIGLFMTWSSGYGLVKALGYTLSANWIGVAMLSSLCGFGATIYILDQPNKRYIWGGVSIGCFFFSLMTMTFRNVQMMTFIAIIASFLVFLLATWLLKRASVEHEEDNMFSQKALRTWFFWLSRCEGVSLLVLFGLFMPLKYGANIVLDGGQGWFGWFHGLFQMTFLVGLISVTQLLKWPKRYLVIGFMASLLPFGTFLFEQKIKKEKGQSQF